jgi:hypothetical protein
MEMMIWMIMIMKMIMEMMMVMKKVKRKVIVKMITKTKNKINIIINNNSSNFLPVVEVSTFSAKAATKLRTSVLSLLSFCNP